MTSMPVPGLDVITSVTLTSPEVHQLLREHCAWDVEKYQGWLRDVLEQSLLKDFQKQ